MKTFLTLALLMTFIYESQVLAAKCQVAGNGKTITVQESQYSYERAAYDQLGRQIAVVRFKPAPHDEYFDPENLPVYFSNQHNGSAGYINPKTKNVYEPTTGGLRLRLNAKNEIAVALNGNVLASAEKSCSALDALLGGFIIAMSMK
jgi:hypothetical protein